MNKPSGMLPDQLMRLPGLNSVTFTGNARPVAFERTVIVRPGAISPSTPLRA